MMIKGPVTFRWLSNFEIENLVNPAMERRNWAALNINSTLPTCKVIGAFAEDGSLVEFFALQLYPILGPMLRTDNEARDGGDTSRTLANLMQAFLEESNARDFMAIANSPMTERLCSRFGMEKLSVPVYVKSGNGEIKC